MFLTAGTAKSDPVADRVINCVACPLKALSKSDGQYYCSHNFNVSKHKISKTSLGEVVTDVIDHCENCSVKKNEKLDKSAEMKLVDGFILCPMTKNAREIKDCARCTCLHLDDTLKYLNTKDKNDKIDKVFCMYPNIDFKSISLKFTPAKRKAILTLLKERRDAAKV